MFEKRDERKKLKSGEEFFFDAMRKFEKNESLIKQKFKRFKKAAKRGHKESQWIVNVVKSAENYKKATLREAFAKTECPIGWYFAGQLCDEQEDIVNNRLVYFKKSNEGCKGHPSYSWAAVKCAHLFRENNFPLDEKNHRLYGNLLSETVSKWPNNPHGLLLLSFWHLNSYSRYANRDSDDDSDDHNCDPNLILARKYCLTAAQLGWKNAIGTLSEFFYYGDGGKQNLIEAIRWSANGQTGKFCNMLKKVYKFFDGLFDDDEEFEIWVDGNTLAWELGRGLFWYMQGLIEKGLDQDEIDFGTSCLKYYCDSIDLQQKSIYTFLWCWNKVFNEDFLDSKKLGRFIAQMVWDGRQENFIQDYDF